jgi:fucose permease
MTENDSGAARNANLIRGLTCLMFFTFAMTTDAVGSVIPRIIDEFRLNLTAASAFQYATMAGIAGGALFLGFLADFAGRKPTIILGLSLYGLSCLLFAVSHAFGVFVALLAIGGLGISVFKTGALALIGDVSASTTSHTRLMNTVEGFFAVGAIVGPAIVATLVARGLSWKWLYIVAALICIALVAAASRVRYPPVRHTEKRATLGEIVVVLKDPLAIGFSLLVMLYVAVEVAIYVWMPTYLQAYDGPFKWLPGYALTLFFILRGELRHLPLFSRIAAARCRRGGLASAAFRPLHVDHVSHAQLEGDQLLPEVTARRCRRCDPVLHRARRGAGSARHGGRER